METAQKNEAGHTAVTSDYDTLHSWLCQNGWFCQWQDKAPPKSPVKYFALYIAKETGAMIITQQYKNKSDGWNYFVATKHGAIPDCLAELASLARGE